MRFDATLKELLEESPAAWPALVGAPARNVEVIDADIATVTGAADKVLRVRDDPEWIHHVEFQAGPDGTLPRRANVYNAVLEDRHGLPVRSSAVLLRREANLAAINGRYERRWPGAAEPYRVFLYDVIRVWELPAERLLGGELGLLPLAPVSAVPQGGRPGVLQRMKERFVREAPIAHRPLVDRDLCLDGIRFLNRVRRQNLAGGHGNGRIIDLPSDHRQGQGPRRASTALSGPPKQLLLLGRDRFGKPNVRVKAAIQAVDDPEALRTPHRFVCFTCLVGRSAPTPPKTAAPRLSRSSSPPETNMIRNLARCPYCGGCEIALDDRPNLVFNPDGPSGPCPHLAWAECRFAEFTVDEHGANHMIGSSDITWAPDFPLDEETAAEIHDFIRELLLNGPKWPFAPAVAFAIVPLSAEEKKTDAKGHVHPLWEVDGSAIYAADAKAFWDALPACRERQLDALDVRDED